MSRQLHVRPQALMLVFLLVVGPLQDASEKRNNRWR